MVHKPNKKIKETQKTQIQSSNSTSWNEPLKHRSIEKGICMPFLTAEDSTITRYYENTQMSSESWKRSCGNYAQ